MSNGHWAHITEGDVQVKTVDNRIKWYIFGLQASGHCSTASAPPSLTHVHKITPPMCVKLYIFF